jgi:hypothetical protein
MSLSVVGNWIDVVYSIFHHCALWEHTGFGCERVCCLNSLNPGLELHNCQVQYRDCFKFDLKFRCFPGNATEITQTGVIGM